MSRPGSLEGLPREHRARAASSPPSACPSRPATNPGRDGSYTSLSLADVRFGDGRRPADGRCASCRSTTGARWASRSSARSLATRSARRSTSRRRSRARSGRSSPACPARRAGLDGGRRGCRRPSRSIERGRFTVETHARTVAADDPADRHRRLGEHVRRRVLGRRRRRLPAVPVGAHRGAVAARRWSPRAAWPRRAGRAPAVWRPRSWSTGTLDDASMPEIEELPPRRRPRAPLRPVVR